MVRPRSRLKTLSNDSNTHVFWKFHKRMVRAVEIQVVTTLARVMAHQSDVLCRS